MVTQEQLNALKASIESYAEVVKAKFDEIGTMAHRNVTISNQDPSGGEDGDIWLKYE